MGESTVSKIRFPATDRQKVLYAYLVNVGDEEGGAALLKKLAALPMHPTVTVLFHAIREGEL